MQLKIRDSNVFRFLICAALLARIVVSAILQNDESPATRDVDFEDLDLISRVLGKYWLLRGVLRSPKSKLEKEREWD